MLDWDDLRFFLAVARKGSLTAAARELQVAQTTVGRRLASLEASFGAQLVQRTPDGYVLTSEGDRVFAQVERVEAEATAIIRNSDGNTGEITGVVRVACTETFATHIIGQLLGDFHVRHPGLILELIPHVQELSLAMREADIAVQLGRSDRNDLLVKRIGRVAYGLYESHGYIERFACPTSTQDASVIMQWRSWAIPTATRKRDGCSGSRPWRRWDFSQAATVRLWRQRPRAADLRASPASRATGRVGCVGLQRRKPRQS